MDPGEYQSRNNEHRTDTYDELAGQIPTGGNFVEAKI